VTIVSLKVDGVDNDHEVDWCNIFRPDLVETCKPLKEGLGLRLPHMSVDVHDEVLQGVSLLLRN